MLVNQTRASTGKYVDTIKVTNTEAYTIPEGHYGMIVYAANSSTSDAFLNVNGSAWFHVDLDTQAGIQGSPVRVKAGSVLQGSASTVHCVVEVYSS